MHVLSQNLQTLLEPKQCTTRFLNNLHRVLLNNLHQVRSESKRLEREINFENREQ